MSSFARNRRRQDATNYWPGFVDALSTLVLVVVFLLAVFMMAQFFLSRESSNKDDALTKLNRQIAELTDLLALERTTGRNRDDAIAALTSTLDKSKVEVQRLKDEASALGSANLAASSAQREIDAEKALSARAAAQVEILNQQIAALRRQLASLEEALGSSEQKDKDAQARIAELGSRLNLALAQRVQELTRYRSDFFGRLRNVLANRPEFRVVGDRFVIQSEILFEAGQASLNPAGLPELDKLAVALSDVAKEIPSDVPWVLRVDGHTDRRPIQSAQFPSNWELSAARAISVVRYLVMRGIPENRLLAGAFGEFQPLETGESDENFRRNRRIELKLTDR